MVSLAIVRIVSMNDRRDLGAIAGMISERYR